MKENKILNSSESIIFQKQEVQQQNEHNNQLPNHTELILREEKFVVDKYVLTSLPKNIIKLIFNNKLQQSDEPTSNSDNNNNTYKSNNSKDIIHIDFDPSYFQYILNSIEQAVQKQKEIDDDDYIKEKKLEIRFYSLQYFLHHMKNKPHVHLKDTNVYNFIEKETFIILREELNYYMLPIKQQQQQQQQQQQDQIKFIQSLKSKVGKSLVDESSILDPLLKKIKKDNRFTDQQKKEVENKEINNNNNNNNNNNLGDVDDDNNNVKIEEKDKNVVNKVENKETNIVNNDDDNTDKRKEKKINQRSFIDMLHDCGFNSTSQWGHRNLEPGKAIILSISMIQLNSDDSLSEKLETGIKILHLKPKPATKCWWEMDEIMLNDIQIKFWKRREWTLQLFSI